MPKLTYERVYLYLTLSLAFSLPLSRAAVSFFIILLGLVWLYEGNLQNKFKTIWQNPLLKAILIFLLFSAFSFLWSQEIHEALNALRLYSYWLVLFVIATSIKQEMHQKIITAFLYGMFVSEFLAYGIYFEFWHFKGASVTNPSPFMFWIDYSVFLALTSILLLNRLFSSEYSLIQKIALSLFFFSANINLFLGYGRTGQVALVVAICVMVALNMKKSFLSLISTMLILITLYGGAYNLSNTFHTRVTEALVDIKKMQNFDFDSSWGIRVIYWMLTYDTLKEHPFFGVGIGDYKKNMAHLIEKNNYPISQETASFMKSSHTHNQFLLVIMQTGLIGLFLMLYIIYELLRVKISHPQMKRLSILFVIIYFVSSFAEPLWLKQFTLVLFILFVGMFATTQVYKISDTNSHHL